MTGGSKERPNQTMILLLGRFPGPRAATIKQKEYPKSTALSGSVTFTGAGENAIVPSSFRIGKFSLKNKKPSGPGPQEMISPRAGFLIFITPALRNLKEVVELSYSFPPIQSHRSSWPNLGWSSSRFPVSNS